MIKIKRKIWLAIVMWGFVFAFVFNMVNFYQPTKHALAEGIYEVFNLSVIYYFTSLYLFPKYFKNNVKYFHVSIISILGFAILFFLIDLYILPDYSNHTMERPPKIFHFLRYALSLGFTYFVATSLSLIEHNNQLLEREKLLTEEKLDTELKLLKAQINPHFIFNALNNIYSLTYMQSKNAPDSVLKLSDMLRYVFYDCSKDRVPLSAELKYIENFTAFQQMKSEFAQNISIETEISGGNIEIAPMLFIPLVENAFKYSRVEENEEAKVSISIKNEDHKLHFRIKNNVPDNKPASGSGMGIKNVRHRLDIIYPGKYVVNIDEKQGLYRVDLSLEV